MSISRMRMMSLLLTLFLVGTLLAGCAGGNRRVSAVSVRKTNKHIVLSLPRLRQ